jgi:hypothetical protein
MGLTLTETTAAGSVEPLLLPPPPPPQPAASIAKLRTILETRNWKLDMGNWKIENGNPKFENRNSKMARLPDSRLCLLQSATENRQSKIS